MAITSRFRIISCSESGRRRIFSPMTARRGRSEKPRDAVRGDEGRRDSRPGAPASAAFSVAMTSGRERQLRLAPCQLDELARRHGLAEVVALHLVAALEPQQLHLLARLDAFRHDLEVQA